MKKIVTLIILSILITACSSKKEGNMVVTGQIKGLKKGNLYLQKMIDTVLVSVDSIALNGDNVFTLTDNVASPVVYYLTFDGNTSEKRLLFFGEKGTITINDNVENFGFEPKITGSKNQELLDEYSIIRKRFQNKRLDFIKKDFEAKKENDNVKLAELEKQYQQLAKRRVLFTTNFALTNADKEVAPYIGLTEMYDASLKMLDTVNSSLSDRVKNSDYGKRFQEYINRIKESEKQ